MKIHMMKLDFFLFFLVIWVFSFKVFAFPTSHYMTIINPVLLTFFVFGEIMTLIFPSSHFFTYLHKMDCSVWQYTIKLVKCFNTVPVEFSVVILLGSAYLHTYIHMYICLIIHPSFTKCTGNKWLNLELIILSHICMLTK